MCVHPHKVVDMCICIQIYNIALQGKTLTSLTNHARKIEIEFEIE